jgi:hypothetical protein
MKSNLAQEYCVVLSSGCVRFVFLDCSLTTRYSQTGLVGEREVRLCEVGFQWGLETTGLCPNIDSGIQKLSRKLAESFLIQSNGSLRR